MIHNLTEGLERFEDWAVERDLYNNSDYDTQWLKFYSELGELTDNLAKGRCIKDDIGDMLCVLTHMMVFSNMPLRGDISQFSCPDDSGLIINITDSINDGKLYDTISYIKGLAFNHQLSLIDCCNVSWNDIKDRKGKFINGTFVKESDLNAH